MSRRGGGRQPSQSPVPSFQRGGGPGGGDRGRGGGGRGRGGGGRARGGGGGGRARGDGSGRGDSSGLQPADYPPVSSLPPATAPLTEASTNPPISRAPVVAVAPPPKASSSSTPPFKIAEEPASASTSASTLSREVESLALAASQLPPASAKAVRFPARPGLGTVGKKIMVRANHFLVQVADKDLHHYDVSISPEITSKKINRDVMTKLVELYQQSHLGGRYPAYDGRKSLYTAGPLPFISKEFVVKLEDNKSAGSSSSMRREREFKVAIKLVAKVDLHHLQQFLCRRQMDAPQETIQLLDVVLRAKPSEEYTVVGRSFFSHRLGQRGELGDGVEYWGGFYQSLRPTQMGLSLNIDLSARAFYEPLLVTDFITKYMNVRELSRPLSDRDRLAVRKVLRSIKVELSHSGCAKSYKITGISVQPLSQLTFTLEDSTTRMSVVQYFRQKYDIKLKYTHLPALQAGSESKPVFLPMELCKISEGQRYTKKLNERQVTNLLRATCQRPQNREMNIKEMVRKNKYNEDIRVNEFGINVLNELALVDARVLPPPRLKYHDTGREASVDPWLGQWNMINKKMINGGRVDNWTCVNFSSRLEKGLPSEFCKQLIQMCISKGMAFNSMPMLPIFSAHPSQIEKALVDIHKQCIDKRAQLQLLIIILPDVTGSYGKIKRICETELGIVSQCCQPRQASRLNKQYFENVALKINVKVGGRNTVLNDAIHRRIPLVSDLPTIIFGADVTHPQPGEDSSPSIAAVVASMDWPEITKYRGLVSAQPHREEIIQDLYKQTRDPDKGLVHTGMVRDLLKAFFKSTGLKPHRIIFYRDGVSEGQFSQVLLYEMDAIRKACNSIQDGYLPPVTFVVVQKRHHTRLFPADHRNRDLTDKSGNIQPGTVVDTKICHPSEFDFYLNSHAGIQGTSRPTHYHVLYDENNFTADQLQVLTNNLCYTYARCTRSVSIVPPAYYAHLAAYRARYYIEGDVSDAESTSGNRSGNVRALPVIKENVKDVMFYC